MINVQIKNSIKKAVTLVMITLLCSISACGYFMYPERVGQTKGQIDPAIVILDALGLFVGVIPGVVAFAVDVTTGTIYLPPGGRSTVDKHRDRMSSLTDAPLTPVKPEVLPVNPGDIADELSILLDQPVEAGAVQFYQPASGAVIRVAAKSEVLRLARVSD